MHRKGQRCIIFWALSPDPSFSLFSLPSAGRPHPRGTAGAGEHPPAQAGAAGGHSGKKAHMVHIRHIFDC